MMEVRSPLARSEDKSTVFSFTDWTSASKLKNAVNPLLRVDIGVLRTLTENVNEIKGYQLTVYNVSTQAIVYKFYIDYIEENVYSMTTPEAITFLNSIGFNCQYNEPIILTDKVRELLNALKSMGYSHIKRDNINGAKFSVLSGYSHERADLVRSIPLEEILAKNNQYINLHDLRFLNTLIPISIDELLEN